MSIKSVLNSAGLFFSGVALIVLPALWLIFLVLSSKAIVGDSVTLWYTTFWLLIATTWLLFCRNANADRRLIVEITVWLASISLFIAAGYPG